MALVTLDYYHNTYLGESVAVAEFPRIELRAQDIILGLVKMSEDDASASVFSEAIKKAVCAEIEYLNEEGIGIATYGNTTTGFTVGKVSVQEGGSAALTGAKSMVCPAVYVYLEQTGLLNPSVRTAGEPWFEGVW